MNFTLWLRKTCSNVAMPIDISVLEPDVGVEWLLTNGTFRITFDNNIGYSGAFKIGPTVLFISGNTKQIVIRKMYQKVKDDLFEMCK